MPKPLSSRKKKILKAMWALGCRPEVAVTTEQIATRTGLNVNGVAQTLGSMPYEVYTTDGKRGARQWKLRNCLAGTL